MKSITKDLGEDVIFDITRTDSEMLFRFKASQMDKLEKYLKPKTNGSNISPFSSKNLPKNKEYMIPDEDLELYKNIVQKIGQNRIIELTHMTRSFLKLLVAKNNAWENIKGDMAIKGLSGKNYIHSIGLWEEYINYLLEGMKL